MDKEKIFRDLEKQRKDRGLTLADAEYIFQQNNFDFKGELVLCNEFNGDVVYWKDWNEKAISLLNEYLGKFNLYKCPTSVIMYMSSGVVLRMPIAKSLHYKTEHWLPVEIVTKEELEKHKGYTAL